MALQHLYLALVISAFSAFAIALFGISFWLSLRETSPGKKA